MRRSMMLTLLLGMLLAVPVQAAQPLRVAVVGGLMLCGCWQRLEEQLEAATGIEIELVEAANKQLVVPTFANGKADLLLIHGGAETFALQAAGLGGALHTWGWNEHVIVGPASDPAGIRDAGSAAAALRKIASSGARFLAPADAGANESVQRVLRQAGISYRNDWVEHEVGPVPHARLHSASAGNAYTVAGAIPVAFGLLAGKGMQTLVSGDRAMRRAFVVLQPGPAHPASDEAREQASRLVAYLLSTAGQVDVAAAGDGWVFANAQGLALPGAH